MALTKVKAGNILLTTPGASSNDVTPATTQYVTTAIGNLIDTAPSTLNTLNELAAALGDDVNFSTTVTNSIATKAPLASPTFTGTITVPGGTSGTRIIKDNYSSGSLANQGTIRSSGGNYWGYGTYQDGSANWKSAVSIALERSVFAIDEDQAYWSHAPSQTVSIGSDLTTQPTKKVVFDLENGRVGIGTDTPDSPLEISGADDTRLKLTDTGDSSELMLRSDGVNTQIYTNTAHDLGIYTSGNVGQLHLKQSNGNVGIGTSSPMSLDGNATPGLTVSSNGPFILLQDANNADKVRYISNNTGQFQFGIVGDNGISGKTEHMRIDTSGNVGIGSDNPSANLDIVGGGSSVAPTLELNSATSSLFNHAINAFNANLTAGEGNLLVVGKAGATKESGWVGYKWNGTGSDNNIVSLGHWGNNWILNVKGNGYVGIGTEDPNSRLMVIDTTDARKQIEFSNHVTYRGSIGHDAGSGRNEYRTEAGGGTHAFFRGATSTTPEMEILADGQILMPYQSSAMAHKNGHHMETSGINDVTSWTIQHNIGSDLSTSGSYTCPRAGRYLCTFSAMSGQTTGDVQFRICRGGTILLGSNSMAQGGGPWRQTTVSGVVNAALGDVLKPVAYSSVTNGSIQQVYTGSYSTLSFHFLG